MAYNQDSCWCDGCGVEITWGPWMKSGRPYCCPDCMAGRPCRCHERVEQEDDRRQARAASVAVGDETY